MSVDERLRAALTEQADTVAPEVDVALDLVRDRGHAIRRRGAALGLVAAAAAAAVVAGLVGWTDLGRSPRDLPAGVPSSSAPAVAPTRGANPTALRGGLDGVVTTPAELAGRWTIRLNGNATLDVLAPEGYDGVVTGALYTADRSTFRTTVFGADLCAGEGTGIYRWLAVGERVEFEEVSDPCATRAAFFEDSVWTVSTAAGSRG